MSEMASATIDVALVLGCALLGVVVGGFLESVVTQVPRGRRPAVRWRAPALVDDEGARSPSRRLILEVTTGAVFAALAWALGPTAALPAFLYLGAVGVALGGIDLEHRRLPNVLTLPSYIIGGALLAVAVLVEAGDTWGTYLRALLGMVVLFAFYFVLALIYPAGMGFGDVKLAGVLGLYLGWLGWGPVVVGAFLGFLLGALVGLALMATRRIGRKSRIPFGPFMLVGALLAVLFGDAIANAYIGSLAG
jgi:leader peptidase (prepilin peptidase) / N-methyltransferase